MIKIVYPAKILWEKEVRFELYLIGKYPFQPPILLCLTVIGFPSIADGRDLVPELLKEKWSPSILAAELISKIPDFFTETISSKQNNFLNEEFGKFHLGNPYFFETWNKKELMRVFFCIENDVRDINYTKKRVIVVTHMVLLILEQQESKNIGFLLSWATLQSLNRITYSKQDPDRITIEWKQIGEDPPYSQQFKIPQSREFIDLITGNLKRIKDIAKQQSKNSVFYENYVNGEEVRSTNIGELLQLIEVFEEELLVSVKNPIGVGKLLELYQKAVEYFAAVDDKQCGIYLEKMRSLLADDGLLGALKEDKIKNDDKQQEEIKENTEINKKNEEKIDELSNEDALKEKNLDYGNLDEKINSKQTAEKIEASDEELV